MKKNCCWFTCFVISVSILFPVFRTSYVNLLTQIFMSCLYFYTQFSCRHFKDYLKDWNIFRYVQRKGIINSLLFVTQSCICSLGFQEKQYFTLLETKVIKHTYNNIGIMNNINGEIVFEVIKRTVMTWIWVLSINSHMALNKWLNHFIIQLTYLWILNIVSVSMCVVFKIKRRLSR